MFRGIATAVLLALPLVSALAQEPPVQELEAATVVANPPAVRTVGDTVVFSTSALSLEDDAMLEDILRMIPGLEYDGKTITLYGRRITKLLVNGRLYFGGDIISGLKNISAESIESLRTYERPSDFARISGIDDGEDEPVLDVKIKRRFMDSWKGFVKGGGGVPSRYRGAFNAGKVTDTTQISIVGNAQNLPGLSFLSNTNLNRTGAGARGETDGSGLGVNYSLKRKRIEIDAHVRYTGEKADKLRDAQSRTIYATGTTFYKASENIISCSDALRTEGKIEWRPSKKTTLLIKPVINFRDNGSWNNPVTMTYRQLPSDDVSPVNTVTRRYANYGTRGNGSISVQLTRRFAKKGRSATVRLNGSTVQAGSWYFNDYLAQYSSKQVIRKQYLESPSSDRDATLTLSYNEPLGKGFHIQLISSLRRVYHGQQREFFSMEGIAGSWTVDRNLSRKSQTGALPASYESTRDGLLSTEGSYSGTALSATASMRYIRKKLNLTAGASLKPVWSTVSYLDTGGSMESRESKVFYAAPYLTLKYKKTKREFLSLTYRSNINTPGPSSLIPVRSGTNPLSVRIGNPDLKPSFVQRVNLTWNSSKPVDGSSLVCELSARLTDNAFTTSTEYIPETGGRIYRSCNIDGNWTASASINWNRSWRSTPWSVSNVFSAAYFNENSLLYNSSLKKDELNTMHRRTAKEQLNIMAKWGKADFTAKAGAEACSGHSLLRTEFNEKPRVYLLGCEASAKLPFKTRVKAEFNYLHRTNFVYDILNRDFMLLNATVSKTILKGKGTLRLEAADILGDQLNTTHRFAGMSISAAQYNGTSQYVILNFVYRFSR